MIYILVHTFQITLYNTTCISVTKDRDRTIYIYVQQFNHNNYCHIKSKLDFNAITVYIDIFHLMWRIYLLENMFSFLESHWIEQSFISALL